MDTKENNEYAIRNILQSLENAIIYCSYFDDNTVRRELKEIITSCQGKVFDTIDENKELLELEENVQD